MIPKSEVDYEKSFESRKVHLGFFDFRFSKIISKLTFKFYFPTEVQLLIFFDFLFELLYQIKTKLLAYFSASMKIKNRQKIYDSKIGIRLRKVVRKSKSNHLKIDFKILFPNPSRLKPITKY